MRKAREVSSFYFSIAVVPCSIDLPPGVRFVSFRIGLLYVFGGRLVFVVVSLLLSVSFGPLLQSKIGLVFMCASRSVTLRPLIV